MLLWPCHLLAFKLLKIPISSNLRALIPLLAQHYAVSPSSTSALPSSSARDQDFPFPLHAHSQREISLKTPWVRHLLRKVALLTIFISFPALSWYASVPLTSMADLTAIYNVFAFVCCPSCTPKPAILISSPLFRSGPISSRSNSSHTNPRRQRLKLDSNYSPSC